MTYKDVAEILRRSGQVFLTGAGGVGKTYCTKEIIKQFKNCLKLASTHLAAQNLNGETLHKVFMLGISKDLQDLEALDRQKVAQKLKHGIPFDKAITSRLSRLKKLLSKTDLIVIDEISMISAQVLDMVAWRLKQCNVSVPILFVGDLLQLPPVSRDRERVQAHYIFNSPYWHPVIIELTRIKRTQDIEFAYHQQHIRRGIISDDTHLFLENLARNTPEIYPEWKPVILCATKAQVDSINESELSKIDAPLLNLEGEYTNYTDFGDFSDFPTDVNLQVKIGCRVIFCQNSIMGDYYNGLQGILREIDEDGEKLSIETYEGRMIYVERAIFSKYHSEISGGVPMQIKDHELIQFPIRLAYALTIHKSQGMTLEHLHIKFDRIFESAQAYVAISRASNTKYLKLEGLHKHHLTLVNNDVIKYLNSQDIIKIESIELDSKEKFDIDKYVKKSTLL